MKASRTYKQLTGLATTRIRLGLSQDVFAMELGISRSILSKAENKKRSLPTSALVKLAALEISLAAERTVQLSRQSLLGKSAAEPVDEGAIFTLKLHQAKARYQAMILETQLARMEASHKQVTNTIQQLLLLKDAVPGEKKRLPVETIEMTLYRSRKREKRSNATAQNTLRHKIAVLYSSAELYTLNIQLLEEETAFFQPGTIANDEKNEPTS